MAWTAIFIAVLFLILKLINVLNVSKEEELRGIDLFQHGEPAYALRIYCAACGEQLQGKTIEQETSGAGGAAGARANFPTIVTDAEGGMFFKDILVSEISRIKE
jgi:hypothetical protein